MPPKSSSTRGASASPNNLSATANNKRLGSSRTGDMNRGASGRGLGASYNNMNEHSIEDEAAYEAQQQEFSRQRQSIEHDESLHRQRHEALQAVALKVIQIEFSKQNDPLGYYKLTKPSTSDEVSKHQITVKLMTCNRAMKPFSILVSLPKTEHELAALTLGELKNRVFEAAKSNYVDPILLPLLQPHMVVLYNQAGKQIGRVEDKEAMERWIAAHPPPTKKLSAAEKAALPAPPPMPTVESSDATVQEFGVEPGSTIYVAVRVATQEVVGSDAHDEVAANKPEIIPPVNPRDLKNMSAAQKKKLLAQQQQQQQQQPSSAASASMNNALTGTSPSSKRR